MIELANAGQTPLKQQSKSNKIAKHNLKQSIADSWKIIPPYWTLKNFVGVNPLHGFIDLKFQDAVQQGYHYFLQADLPQPMQKVNIQSIKWLQAYFDDNQATFAMPLREQGLLAACRQLIAFDKAILSNSKQKTWLAYLPLHAEEIIAEALLYLGIASSDHTVFLRLMLSTLPGWAALVQQQADNTETKAHTLRAQVTLEAYLAFRLILTCLLWPDAKQLLTYHRQAKVDEQVQQHLAAITEHESKAYQHLPTILEQTDKQNVPTPRVQMVFCMDTRSSKVRRLLEANDNYQTFGFAGFFGIPVQFQHTLTQDAFNACPVLLEPSHRVALNASSNDCKTQQHYHKQTLIKRLYQSLKYSVGPAFTLVEALGLGAGVWMMLRSILPRLAYKIKNKISYNSYANNIKVNEQAINLSEQCRYTEDFLRTIGMTSEFGEMVVLCGHQCATENNAYKSALDCGACGGQPGRYNAQLLAAILNQPAVRVELKQKGIEIPQSTYFLAAEHNTTTDNITCFDEGLPKEHQPLYKELQSSLIKVSLQAGSLCSRDKNLTDKKIFKHKKLRSQDWREVRPEWGLAGNEMLVIGPRWLTQGLDLQNSTFLYSYDWRQDKDAANLSAILMGPLLVAQWINAQYLFSSLDNVAFGSGSKITHNITGKIGVMQGNASDLMHGLPLQSVYSNDRQVFHKPVRLMTVIYAPRAMITGVIQKHTILQQLFTNGWVKLVTIDPEANP